MATHGMAPLFTRCPELAGAETRIIRIRNSETTLPDDEYALTEYYCEDPSCDCRRALICVQRKASPRQILCAINFGWESEAFYVEKFSFMPRDEALDMARDIVSGELDPFNPQCEGAEFLLDCFRDIVKSDPSYVTRLGHHYTAFRKLGPSEQRQEALHEDPEKSKVKPGAIKIPKKHRARFDTIAALIIGFGERELDEELTGFALELWARVCRTRDNSCERGKPEVWAASVVHVIARMNFLYDRSQPGSIHFDDICDYFATKKTTVGNKATQIERRLKLPQRGEPGLCRRKLLEAFTMVRSPEGMVMPFRQAKELGYLPPDMQVEELWRRS